MLVGFAPTKPFYKICCQQASNKFTMLPGLEKQLLVKLGGLDTRMLNFADISLAFYCKALKVTRVLAGMLAAFPDIRLL